MAGNGALDLSIRIMGKVDPSLAKTISQVKGLAGSLAGEMRGVNSLASTVTNVLGVVGKAGLALGATLTGAVAAGIQKTTNEAVKLEAQMAPVMRYVDGLADSSGKASDQMSENGKTYAQNYANMENYIQRLSMEIPRTTEQLSTMSAALGQSGKDVDEQTTSGILRDTAVAATAMDLEDRTAGDYMAKWEVSFTKKDENGNKIEPIEQAVVECPEEYSGKVIEIFGTAGGTMVSLDASGLVTHLEFKIPTRGIMGLKNRILNVTHGDGVFYHTFLEYGPYAGDIGGRKNGAMISMSTDKAVAYALGTLQERGTLFVAPGDACYEGMIVGESARPGDMVVNVAKTKNLGNQRSSTSDISVQLTPPRTFTLEEALEYITDDELVEITPQNVRMRKRLLSAVDRKKAAKK